jgi:large subunit ribosomal protein L18e
MKIREKNGITKEMIADIRRRSFENQSRVWKAVAEELNRPRRKRFEVNLNRLEKYAKANERIVVPGVVLGSGEIKKKLIVAAFRFSGKAREKIEKSGGECLSVEEMLERNPKGRGIRMMG